MSDGAPTSLSLLSLLLSPRLGEELSKTGGREEGVAELGQHVAEVGPRVNAQPVAAEHEGVDGRGAVAGLVAAEEEPVLPAQGNAPFILPQAMRKLPRSTTDGTHWLASRFPSCTASIAKGSTLPFASYPMARARSSRHGCWSGRPVRS